MAVTQPTIWHNPRCSKSRETLSILEEAGFQPAVVKYLDAAFTQHDIREALAQLKMDPSELIRKGESVYKDLGLANASDDALIAAMVSHPILIERPIVFHKGKAALGRPPKSVLNIL